MSVQTFTTTGTWTCPPGITSVMVECWGAGASGGYGSNNSTGGGGGAYAKKSCVVSPSTIYTVTVGVGGVSVGASSNGNVGGDSWFISNSTVKGGGGSAGQFSNSATSAGAGTGGSFIGDSGFNGGTGSAASGGHASGGGGGADSGGAGGNSAGGASQSGGSAGSGGVAGAGGAGILTNSTGNGGISVGGGGGSITSASGGGATGAGANGEVKLTYGPYIISITEQQTGNDRVVKTKTQFRTVFDAQTSRLDSVKMLGDRIKDVQTKSSSSWKNTSKSI